MAKLGQGRLIPARAGMRKVWPNLNRFVYGVFVRYLGQNDKKRLFSSFTGTLKEARRAKRAYLNTGCVQGSRKPALAVLIVKYERD